ncbi:glutamine cyclotransferase [Allopusillimonas soli]|uniref:Glutamine cyclotransferase n=1 Tax=Allopusillimonas soli TaxID=659016 RepID=A0A853FBV2_9BURK|nr:glutamine cyclotransferase [Allopusillimonas soli]NYT37427.1 glutamine cyclotransferase [Allopusillimonas soli]TEA74591.1 glutamine cyclotransferase [Allopusillimonas soli]
MTNANLATKVASADIVREYGPFPGVDAVHGVSHDGRLAWIATGDALKGLDLDSGLIVRSLDMTANAGTAFDGRFLFQLADGRIQKIDPESGAVLATISAPEGGHNSGLAWAEGSLWIAQYEQKRIHRIDPDTGAVQRTLNCSRYVTGVTWANGALWHGTWEDDSSDLRRIDPRSGAVLETIAMPSGTGVSGLEFDGEKRFICGGGKSGKIRTVRAGA